MFQRFHEAKERREGGFTLIELLVVILIIAILAAIAIPVFLRQREKGWRSQMQSALKNAATAQESFLTVNGRYAINSEVTGATGTLEAEGFKKAADVTLSINFPTAVSGAGSSGARYCMYATHTKLSGVTYYYDSNVGEPNQTTCS